MRISFIGLGNMGLPMAQNLIKAGHSLKAFDVSDKHFADIKGMGGEIASSVLNAVQDVDVVISMLPEGVHVRSVYMENPDVINTIFKDTLIIDCSTIDMKTCLDLHNLCESNGIAMLDAPVSGGVMGAQNATLTFMVGGESQSFEKALPILQAMGKRIVHCGRAGTGQAAKICNNMVLGITMIATSEAFILAKQMGLEPEKFFEVASESSAQNWSLTSYCPVPGMVPTSPANRDYVPGFTARMMLKDLKLASSAAEQFHTNCVMGNIATQRYSELCDSNFSDKDFSSVIKMIEKETKS